MRYQIALFKTARETLRCLMPICFAAALMSQDGIQVHARVVLGFQGIANNATGDLSIEGDALVFQTSAGPSARIPVGSIRGVSLSQEDKEVGGTPMAFTRAATPFGGGRVIGLFGHKKYDFLTLEYLDSNGGFHGTICQLNKGQGQVLGTALQAKGVHLTGLNDETGKAGNGTKDESK